MMQASDTLLQNLHYMISHGFCEQPDNKFIDDLYDAMKEQEDYAFKETASVRSPWICHSRPLRKAERYLKEIKNVQDIEYPDL